VSDMKNAEIAQTRVAKEARERKKQQERFIDMYEPRWIEMCRSNLLTLYRISHEIRNPLSAVIHCAENIMDAVQGGEAKSDTIAVDEIVDAVHTIQLCVDHQASLADDCSQSPANLSCRKLSWMMYSAFRNSMPPCSRLLPGKYSRSEVQGHC
jgi:signal transduction histidine kinase